MLGRQVKYMKPFIATPYKQAHMLITKQSTRLTKTTKGTRSRFFTGTNKTRSERKDTATTRTQVLEQLEVIKSSVSEFPAFVPTLNKYLSGKCNTFTADKGAQFVPKWKQITSDTNIVSDVSGVKIEFDIPPVQHDFKQTKFAPQEEAIIKSEI